MMVRRSFLAAPALLLAGVLAMKFGWKGNDDLGWGLALPLWTVAHVLYVLGYLGFGVVLVSLWSRARKAAAGPLDRAGVETVSAVGGIGLIAMLGQMVIDLVVGFRAPDRAGMSAISKSIHDIPGFGFFYGLVPALLFVAATLLIAFLAVHRRVPVWPAAVFAIGSFCVGTGVTALMIGGGVALCVALPALAPNATGPARATAAA
ncbi:hypothetical protein [Amycolatopsis sp. CA-230715]|uniref:hypothetical protein n=1 Tax=Amycolatopsis sp. CA-230715 TaxID=2745196 RepID=UPI001C03547B|nr:hypothetical protein [Amycolatopsis sp. CA-230715]QWF81829.1 hypothetical protein HUW46_05262 [Amycolatopsis sp. CA-230715]